MKITRDRNAFYLTGKIGEKRSTTPEGFLVCHDVPIARTGTQLYTSDEVPVDPGPDGLVRIARDEEQVFRPETIASFEGKPVTVNHPDEFVNPDNWKNLTVGFVQNVRRGDGIFNDMLLADLVITDADGIKYVNDSLPEVSCGYEADYEQTDVGHGMQLNIIGNHVALVDKGRAGSRCAIQDSIPSEGKMGTKKKSFMDRLRELMKDAESEEKKEDEEEVKDADMEEKEEEEKEKTSDADIFEQRLSRIESIVNKLVPLEEAEHGQQLDAEPDEEEKEEETVDTILEPEGNDKVDTGTVLTGDSLKQVIARAEILAPGIAIPTGDAAKGKHVVPRLQAKALQAAMTTDTGKAIVEPFLMGRELGKLTFDQLGMVFTGAAELMRARNNASLMSSTPTKDFGKPASVEAINAKNKEFWAKNK
jgi:uncharacterized protein